MAVSQLRPISAQGDLVSRRADPPSQVSHALASRLISTTSHAKQWEATGSQAATQTEASGPAVMSPRLRDGSNCSVVLVDGAVGRHGGALSTWAPLRRPTEPSVLELLQLCLHCSEALFQLRVVVRVCLPAFDQLLSCLDEALHLVTSLEEVHRA